MVPVHDSPLDRPEVLARLFHPRRESGRRPPRDAEELEVPLPDGATLGARFFCSPAPVPTLLFFHGNGEIVEDYDDFGPGVASAGLNFLPVDYRGYGRSSGRPSAGYLLADCHVVLPTVRKWLGQRHLPQVILVAGRSLGSVPALELASARGYPEVAGLLIESGFACTLPLLRTLGVDVDSLGLREESGFGNLEKIRLFSGPTLIIHGEDDRLIPVANAHALHAASGARAKRLLLIPGADHNSLFLYGLDAYLLALADLAAGLVAEGES